MDDGASDERVEDDGFWGDDGGVSEGVEEDGVLRSEGVMKSLREWSSL